MITTDNNEYLYSLHDLSAISHTFNILENEIDHVIFAVKSKNFSAVVLNNVLVIANVWKYISEKYPHILNIHYIVYFVNLITKNILDNFFSLIIYF